ncbi:MULTISPECIES: DUF4405 domain-containing protein [Thalassospira]|uniref:DUF4405 domain-containing protein n=2 Tax=Thalassospira TaxID=168934 RepID=A0A367W1U3_9PROT|nr:MULTISPECIES: DUF4405 domain-containing protein [Thalassospira]MDG4721786.1 DUF4405 domain-containing protein [Thalassospira sp. FZY0004]RCK31324.1 hypothetical protein TH19_21460 [Thalassospira profundimaris]
MNAFANRYSTPFLTGLFLVSLISGIALFFHWSSGTFHAMHEWLSMVLILPFAFHIWKNWRALIGYIKRKQLIWPLVISLIAAAIFVVPSIIGNGAGSGGNPAFRAISTLSQAPITHLAPVLATTPEDVIKSLQDKGLSVISENQTLEEISRNNGADARDLVISLLPSGK